MNGIHFRSIKSVQNLLNNHNSRLKLLRASCFPNSAFIEEVLVIQSRDSE